MTSEGPNQETPGNGDEPSASHFPKEATRGQHSYSFRLEYARDAAVDGRVVEQIHLLPGWYRDLEVAGTITLEQLSAIILQILHWDPDHLYEFRIGSRIYVYLGDDDFFVDAQEPCVSCDIPISLLGLAQTDTFVYIFDFGDYHTFRLTVLGIQRLLDKKPLPRLLSHRGKNIIQYPGTMSRAEVRTFQDKPPAVSPPEPKQDRWSIRFVRGSDRETLTRWRTSNDKRLWQKAVAVLENRKLSPEQIAQKVEKPLSRIWRWIKAFNRYGIDGLKPSRKRPVHPQRDAAIERKRRRVLAILHDRPRSYGINRSNWSLPSLVLAYQREHNEAISRATVGRLIRKSGYVMKKARKVLSSPDPEYREKVELLLHTLQNLEPGDLFFFVDELGPLRVKQYGGRAFVPKNQTRTFPQAQTHRGSVTMTGALSATTNQVTWIYGESKDSAAMIDLIEVLFNQHRGASRLYVTWDAASWHGSELLVEWLDAFNAETEHAGERPIIRLIPLPSSSQFLDVIEAVFSGMKRAVIHHSDYQSAEEMKTAISRHFRERNAYFLENPKRVGKKIWEVDFFADYENIRSGDYREW